MNKVSKPKIKISRLELELSTLYQLYNFNRIRCNALSKEEDLIPLANAYVNFLWYFIRTYHFIFYTVAEKWFSPFTVRKKELKNNNLRRRAKENLREKLKEAFGNKNFENNSLRSCLNSLGEWNFPFRFEIHDEKIIDNISDFCEKRFILVKDGKLGFKYRFIVDISDEQFFYGDFESQSISANGARVKPKNAMWGSEVHREWKARYDSVKYEFYSYSSGYSNLVYPFFGSSLGSLKTVDIYKMFKRDSDNGSSFFVKYLPNPLLEAYKKNHSFFNGKISKYENTENGLFSPILNRITNFFSDGGIKFYFPENNSWTMNFHGNKRNPSNPESMRMIIAIIDQKYDFNVEQLIHQYNLPFMAAKKCNVIPMYYAQDGDAIIKISFLYVNKRANNITDLINLYETEKWREQVLERLDKINETLQQILVVLRHISSQIKEINDSLSKIATYISEIPLYGTVNTDGNNQIINAKLDAIYLELKN